ncbi:toxin-antitoxin system, toxin component [Streptomyces sp. NPDC046805]|uniref:toxin-antitoxin system, toxin component n=1 Tax=Streptomyces sp. NPDC046805 TaxID=3155134 RepID=UPI0033E39876
MRRLSGELAGELRLPAPAAPRELYAALCEAMSRRRGRPVLFREAVFPPGTASGLWLDLTDRDLVVVEERTTPEHQLVILGHELWHMKADHGGHLVDGVAVAARLLGDDTDRAALQATVHKIAARTGLGPHDEGAEREAEAFGLLLASKCRTWLAGSSLRGPVRRNHLAGRIEAALGYPGPQG